MTNTDPNNIPAPPDRFTQALHLVLLLLSSALIATRCHIGEAFPTRWRISGPAETITLSSGETPAMLIIAGIIFSMTLLWFLNQARCKIFTWRKTALLLPTLLLLIAGILSTCAASNKHTALIGVVNFLGAATLALLLIQLLDARWKIHLILAVLTATGVTLAYRCWEQKIYDAPETTKQTLENFDETLARQGIEPGTLAASQFKGRLLSQDIGGFFAISNTAASFFILSIFATLALVNEKLRDSLKANKSTIWLIGCLLVAPQLYGLAITQSKGGIGACFAALLLAALLYTFRQFLHKHWKASFIIALLVILLAATAIIGHGLYYDRLPSNSMWLRWQYWQASFAMFADHPFTGVGAENFGHYYPRYMDPAAPEVVKDPHNLWLALLTQWGPLGLLAFIWGMIALSRKVIAPQPETPESQNTFRPKILHALLITVPIILLVFSARFLTTGGLETLSDSERYSVVLISFITPAIVWAIAFLLALTTKEKKLPDNIPSQNTLTPILLGSALLGFLLHNSIDFAIFQPALTTTCFALAAVCFASRQIHNRDHTRYKKLSPFSRWIFSIITTVMLTYFWMCSLALCNAHQSLRHAQNHVLQAEKMLHVLKAATNFNPDMVLADMEGARKNIQRAIHLNPLDPDGYNLQAKISFRIWQIVSPLNPRILLDAIDTCQQAAQRDPENFSYYHQMAQLYRILAEQEPSNKDYLNQALEAARQAYERNPVKPEVMIDYANLLEKNGQPDQAAAIYRLILNNEQAFQNQQKQMNPARKDLPSRLTPSLKQQVQQALE